MANHWGMASGCCPSGRHGKLNTAMQAPSGGMTRERYLVAESD